MSYIRKHLQHKAHWVYRLYDADHTLLYVGCTSQLPLLRVPHLIAERSAVWRQPYTYLEAELFASGPEAIMEEGRLIDELQPPCNLARSGVGLRREAGLPA